MILALFLLFAQPRWFGVDSYNKAHLYCNVNPNGRAWWYDWGITHRWVSMACPQFQKTYKAVK